MFLISYLISVLFLHPFHVSVSEVKYKEDKKSIQISTRIFLDDLEVALRYYSGDQKLDITDESSWEFINENLRKYFLERYKIADEKKRYELEYVGAEIEKDVMWIYVQALKVKKLGNITIRNTLLFETYQDQENLIHFRANGTVKSERFYVGDESKVFSWGD